VLGFPSDSNQLIPSKVLRVFLTDGFKMCMLVCMWRCDMRTNVVIDDDLINEALKLSGVKTKKDVISFALREFVAARKRANLLDLEGKIEFQDDYDYKALRENK
jgi:Arc/MetJ family transcription regulator